MSLSPISIQRKAMKDVEAELGTLPLPVSRWHERGHEGSDGFSHRDLFNAITELLGPKRLALITRLSHLVAIVHQWRVDRSLLLLPPAMQREGYRTLFEAAAVPRAGRLDADHVAVTYRNAEQFEIPLRDLRYLVAASNVLLVFLGGMARYFDEVGALATHSHDFQHARKCNGETLGRRGGSRAAPLRRPAL